MPPNNVKPNELIELALASVAIAQTAVENVLRHDSISSKRKDIDWREKYELVKQLKASLKKKLNKKGEEVAGHVNQKITDNQLMNFFVKFFLENGQFPPAHAAAEHFNVANNAITIRLKALVKKGYLKQNSLKKYTFNL